MKKKLRKSFYLFLKIGIVISVLLVSGFLHAYNMFNFPYFESDEGTYNSQAWSILKEHRLTPYTYWYDHPPFGWIAMSLWYRILSSDFFTFGSSIETGRVLMLLVHLLSAGLIFYIVYKLTNKQLLPAVLAVLVFSISPLGIYFQRRILLDNLLIVWVLLSLAVLLKDYKKFRLTDYLLSGLFFALGVLTKVTAVIFGPAILYLVVMRRSPIEKSFRIGLWLAVGSAVISVYLLSALLKGEFFPGEGHVSFLGSLKFQSSRWGGYFWLPNSDLQKTLMDWIGKDKGLVVISAVIFVWGTIMSFFKRDLIFVILGASAYLLFLIRGGVVMNFYILPLIPFVAILSGMVIHYTAIFLGKLMIFYQLILVIVIGLLGWYYYNHGNRDVFLRNETINQKKAVTWIKENLPADSAILIDVYAYVDLHDDGYINKKAFADADWYYKVSRDKEIGLKKYNNDWRNFDYILLTHEMLKQIKDGDDDFIKVAFQNSLPKKRWVKGTHSFIDEQKFISTNGDWAMLFEINDNTNTELNESWVEFKKNYWHSYGQIINPISKTTTARNQGLAMLKAVEMNDKEAFKGLWLWTKDHLQYRSQDRLFAGAWKDDAVLESDNHSDADGDIAIALLFAYKQWNERKYLQDASVIIKEIWRQNVLNIKNRYYLLATNKLSAHKGTIKKPAYLVEPANFSPAWYRIFAKIDPAHNWNKLADDCYDFLEELASQEKETGLIPEKVVISTRDGKIKKLNGENTNKERIGEFHKYNFGWRIFLDWQWFKERRAKSYIGLMNEKTRSVDNLRLSSGKSLKENSNKQDRDTFLDFVQVMYLLGEDSERKFHNYYDKYILTQYNYIDNVWKGENRYYKDTLGWLVVAVYNNKFINIWEKK